MTWEKKGTEWPDDCAEAGLSDAAYRTHDEATNYVYRNERTDCRIKKSTIRRWAGSDRPEAAITELINAGFWADRGTEWEILHHADVIRQSIAAQTRHREKEKDRQRKKRSGVGDSVDSNVGSNVGSGVGTNVGETQSDRQTDSSEQPGSVDEQIDEQTGEVLNFDPDPWAEPSGQQENPFPKPSGNPSKCRCGLAPTARNPQCRHSPHDGWRQSA